MNCSVKASKNKRSRPTMELANCNTNKNKKCVTLHGAIQLTILKIENIHLKYEYKTIGKCNGL